MTAGEDLMRLSVHAEDIARAYTSITESMLRHGVPEEVARFEARRIVIETMMHWEMGPDADPWDET